MSEDPAWLLAGEALQQAGEAAKRMLEKIPAEKIGLILSTTKANIEALERVSENRPCSESRSPPFAGEFSRRRSGKGIRDALARCKRFRRVRFRSWSRFQQGAKLIQRGEADAVFVVGVDCLSEFVVAGFTALKAIDPAGCRPFDAARCGLSPGEAGAAMVLVRAELIAPQRQSQIRGFGGSNDANHLTGPSRDGSGLAQAIRAALESAKLSPEEIDYVHAHGTGTAYNDAMESLALKTIFGDACPPVSGSKGMLGHTLGAAGVIETIMCMLAMQENFLPGTPGLNIRRKARRRAWSANRVRRNG